MTLFHCPTGPMLRYKREKYFNKLEIYDLNPEVHIKWSVSRWEMFKIGLKCCIAAIFNGSGP